MNTPWGRADHQETLTRGLTIVSTPRHGGVMISKGFAEKNLSEVAIKKALIYNNYLAYEEDCDMSIIIFELPQYFTKENETIEEIAEEAKRSVSAWNADYLIERGIEPTEAEYKYYQEMQKRYSSK